MFLIMMKSGFRAWLMLAKYCQKRTFLHRKKTFIAYLIPAVKPGKYASGYKRMYLPEFLFRK